MDRFNTYQKIRIILLILIIIAGIVLIVSFVKNKNNRKFAYQPTLSDITYSNDENDEMIIALDDEEVEDDGTWDDDILEEEEEDKKEEKNEIKEPTYYIKINYAANVVTAYTKDSSGKYTVPAKAMVCSTGTATPRSGAYKLSNKWRWHALFGGVYGQYCTQITGNILFHSVPYTTTSPDALKYTAYDKLGTAASAGCIRLTVIDAMWVYNNCERGTYVEFYASSDPGPLGKPSAQKISSNEQCRGWDPTDPDSRNPWRTYKEPVVTPPAQEPQPVNQPDKPKEPTPEPKPEPIKPTPSNTVNNNTTTNTNTTQNVTTNTTTNTTQNNNTTTNNNVNTNKTEKENVLDTSTSTISVETNIEN